jgi:HK97 family phage prohead protease
VGYTVVENNSEIKNDLEKKLFNCSFEVKQINDEDPTFFVFEGHASTFGNVDLGDDVVQRGAFADSLKQDAQVPILWQHSMSEPIGKSIELYEDNKGLFVKARLPKEDDLVKGRVIPQMKVGSIAEMSIGFFIVDSSIETREEKQVRLLEKIKLFEISLVTKAMNPQALVTSFKAVSPDKNLPLASRDRDWDSDAAVARIREFSGSQDAPSPTYKKFFMFYDADNSDLFTAYKLPFVDIIDGEPHIVPKAIFAIAGALSGARGGVDIPQEDKDKIINVINGCYRRMAEEFDDESLVSPFEKSKSEDTDLEYKSVDELPADIKAVEKFLKFKGLSSNESKAIISRIKETMKQREVADQIVVREEQTSALISELKNLTNYLKGNK